MEFPALVPFPAQIASVPIKFDTGTHDKDALVRAAALAAIGDVAPLVWQLAAAATQTTTAAIRDHGASANDYTGDVKHQHLLNKVFADVAARWV